ncbi:MAG: DUF4347 domain-containing protein [Bdellovibrionales bacterium]
MKIFDLLSLISNPKTLLNYNHEHPVNISHSARIALEPRIVFDGAGAITAVANIDDASNADDSQNTDGNDNGGIELPYFHQDNSQAQITEIAFIDMRIPDADILSNNLRDNVQVIYIDPTKDGFIQINNILSSQDAIDSAHIFTHADSNGFHLGNSLITSKTISDNAENFSAWHQHLSENSDILFYGCDLAENSDGRTLLATIAELTGADVAASTDLTGAEALGGDWDLEFETGIINTNLAITNSGISAFNHVLAAVPEATVSGPSQDPLIGEQTTFTVTFDNTDATDAGFAPYVNLFLPHLGADGVYNPATDTYTSSQDGLSFVSATYLGTSLETTTITLEDINGGLGGIQFEHPEAIDTAGDPLVVTLDPGLGLQEGDQLVILTLPFGSYTAGQPAADINVTVSVSSDADVGSGLDVITSAGFKFGNTAENDFDSDPSIQAATLNAGNTNSATITPQLLRVTATQNGLEGETATGPNFERAYDIEVEVAPGQTLDNVSVDFTLGEEMVYTSGSATGGGVLDITNLAQTAGGDLSDDIFTVDFTTLTGTQTLTANFFVDELDQSGVNVISTTTGASVAVGETNNVVVTYDWDTTDARDTDLTGASETASAPQITAKSIAIQKSVSIAAETGSAGATPGDTLEYTLNGQISDFFAYDTITVQDVFDDGQLLTGTPTLTIIRQGSAEGPYTFSTNFTDTTIAGDDHRLDFDISGLLTTNAVSDILEGGKFGADDLGGTTFTITYQTIIQDAFDSQAGNTFLKQGDTLSNSATISGRLLDATLTPVVGPVTVTDGSTASVTIPNNEISLSIFALNGSTTGTLTDIKPGDDVTFRLEYDLVTGDLEDFFLDAYLPLPVFNLNDINDDGSMGENFVLDNINAIPTVGDFRYGPTTTADITSGVPSPTPTIDTASNFVRFNLGDLSDPTNDGGKIDILFTIRTSDDPFADGLSLTTLSQQSDSNSPASPTITNDLGAVTIQQPEINAITKGIVSTDNSGGTFSSGTPSGIKAAGNIDANPLNTTITSTNLDSLNLDNDLSGVDTGDLVRYAIVIENTGTSPNGAFDVSIADLIPAGMEVPGGGLNLRVVDGTGATKAFTSNGVGGSEVFDLTLNDGVTGAIGGANGTAGENIIIITYDLEVSDPAEAADSFTETATLSNFSNVEGGDDFTAVDLTDDATVTIDGTDLTKTITNTDQSSTSGNNAIVGEIIEYTLSIVIPEGTSSSAVLVDTLDAGLAFVAIDSITASSIDLTTDAGGGFAGAASGAAFANIGGGPDNDGREVTITLGNITNTNTDNATTETLTVVYRAIVVNTSATNGGATLNNNAVLTTTNGSESDSAVNITVVEPQVNVTITPDVTEADIGDTINWTVTLTAPSGNMANAFDVNFDNIIPAGLTYVGTSFSHDAGVTPTTQNENGGDFNATFANLTPGQTSTFTFQTTIDAGATLSDSFDNSGTATWNSISGALTNPSPNTTVDTQRTGAGGINDYTTTSTGSVDILLGPPVLSLDSTSETATPSNDVVPGEIVRYRFVMQIPESVTNDFRVEPELPNGLQYLNDGTTTIAFVSNGGLSADGTGLAGNGLIAGDETTVSSVDPSFIIPSGLIIDGNGGSFEDGDNPQFQLGTLNNTDSDTNGEFVVIEFNALVLNNANVDDGDTLGVNAEVLEGTTSVTTSNTVNIDVEEPALTNLNKIITDSDGTTATYQITFENTSGVDAFDVDIDDILPANMTNLQNVTITPSGGVTGIVDSSTGTAIDIDITDFPDGGSITITYTADIVDTTMIVADTDVDVTWTSIDGTTASLGGATGGASGTTTGERDSSGGVDDYTISEGAGLNVITGTLWDDVNLNTNIDGGETRIDNVQVNLVHAGADGIFGNGDDLTFTDITDVNGDYSFGAIPAGDIRITVQPNGLANGLPPQYRASFDPTGSTTDSLIERTLGDGVTSANNNFGFEVEQPPAGADNTLTANEDTPLGFVAADFGFTDPNPSDTFDNIRIDTLPTNGILRLSGVPVTAGQVIDTSDLANLTFTPNANVSGAPLTSFDFSVQDDTGLFDPAPNTITINVTPVADPPDGTDKTLTIRAETPLGFTPADFGFSDPDGDTFNSVRIDTLPSNGTLLLSGVPVTAGQVLSLADIANLTFTSVAGVDGFTPISFDFSVEDSSGSFDIAPNTITIAINDVPLPILPTPSPLPPAPPTPFAPIISIGERPSVNPFSGLRVFETGFNPFKDISFEYDISRPDFWIAGSVDQKLIIENKEAIFQVSKSIFKHSNPGEPLTFSAELEDGSPLPPWLSFDSGDLSFRGTPPLGSPKALEIVIIAKDTRDEQVKAPVRVLINDENDANGTNFDPDAIKDSQSDDETSEEATEEELEDQGEEEETTEDEKQGFIDLEGRPSFSDQLAQETRYAQIIRNQSFLESILKS